MPESTRRKRNLWVLVPGARPISLGLEQQPPANATWWCLEGDTVWHPMPAGWADRQGQARTRPAPQSSRGKHNPAPGQGTLWPQPGVAEIERVEPCRPAAKPFLRYPGGKTYLLSRLQSLLAGFPCEQYDYLEPMIGGGAVFWAFGPRFRTRALGDLNPELVTLYRIIRNDVEGLIAHLQSGEYEYHGKHDPESLARFRHLLHSEPDTQVQQAARYLYINRSCWGGMIRFGRGRLKASPNSIGTRICDPGRLRACHRALQGTQILRGSAHQVIAQARAAHPERKFLLLVDPPYHDPDPKKFVNYSGAFTQRDQADLVRAVLQSGWRFIYTNKATDLVCGLFAQARGIERITLPLRHKLGFKGPLEQELLVNNLI